MNSIWPRHEAWLLRQAEELGRSGAEIARLAGAELGLEATPSMIKGACWRLGIALQGRPGAPRGPKRAARAGGAGAADDRGGGAT